LVSKPGLSGILSRWSANHLEQLADLLISSDLVLAEKEVLKMDRLADFS
jgi:hypothetical protein